MKRLLLTLILLFVTSSIFAQAPSITSFSPATGAVGTAITINGANFSTTADSNRVFIGGVRAAVTAASATSLTVTVPQGAVSGKPSLSLRGFSVQGATSFQVTYSGAGIFDRGSFPFETLTEVGTSAYDVATGDFDADGKPDAAVVNYGSNTVSILVNLTAANASVPVYDRTLDLSTGTNSNPRTIETADIDGDGRLDLVVGCAGYIAVFRNTTTAAGNPTFAARVELSTPSGSAAYTNRDLEIGDLDGDGKLDIASATYGENARANVELFRNQSTVGAISFSTRERLTSGDPAITWGIAISDLDGDGKKDVALSVDYNSTSSLIRVYRNTNNAGTLLASNFQSPVNITVGGFPRDIEFGFIDTDTRPDLVIYNGSGTIQVAKNTGSSGTVSFATPISLPALAGGYRMIVQDIDGDSKEDVLVSYYSETETSTLAVFKNIHSSTTLSTAGFESPLSFSVGKTPYGFAIGDINLDSKPDLLVANLSIGNITTVLGRMGTASPVVTSFSPANGRIGSSLTISGSGFSSTLAQNIVLIGGRRATITSANATNLTVTVPSGAVSSPVSVTVGGITAISARPFAITFADSGTLNAIGFSSRQTYGSGVNAYNIAKGDFNNDGKIDLAIANYSANRVEIYINQETGVSLTQNSFAAPITLNTGTSSNPRSLAVGDFDADGFLDVAAGCANTIAVFRNTTIGSNTSFGTALQLSTPSGSAAYTNQDLEVGDIDGDGMLDIASATYGGNSRANAELFQNTSSPGVIGFGDMVRVTSGDNVITYGIAIGDADGDGKNDIALGLDYNGVSSLVRVYRNINPVGALLATNFETPVNITLGGRPFDIEFGFLDTDNRIDLAAVDFNGSLRVMRNTGSAENVAFQTPITYSIPNGGYNLEIADLDGDTKPDFVLTNSVTNASSTITLVKNQTTTGSFNANSFAVVSSPAAGVGPLGVTVGDFNGDGKPDVAVSNYNSTGGGSFTVFQNRSGIVSPTISSFSSASATVGASVTINGSGFSATQANNIVYLGPVQGTVTASTANSVTFTVPASAVSSQVTVITNGLAVTSAAVLSVTYSGGASVNQGSFFVRNSYSAGNSPVVTAAGDFNNDGKPDVVVVNQSDNNAVVYVNNSANQTLGSSSFQQAVALGTGTNSSPRSVAVGDLDNDGKLDVVVGSVGKVTAYRNTTSGTTITFAVGIDLTHANADNPGSSLAIDIGDIDGDGKKDIAVASYGSNSRGNIEVFQNLSESGSLTFTDYIRIASPFAAYSYGVAIADFDNDGKNDLVQSLDFASSNSRVYFYRNTGTPGSITPSNFNTSVLDLVTGGTLRSLAVGYLDNDANLDVVVANNTGTLLALRNTSTSGTIAFATAVAYNAGANTNFVAIGDLNGDGRADLISANRTTPSLIYYPNQMTTAGAFNSNSFTTVGLTSGSFPQSPVITDFDADGKPDILFINNETTSGTFSVIRNNIGEFGVTSVSPSGGQPNAAVTINGFNFSGSPVVRFGTTQSAVNNSTSSIITTSVPASLSPGKYLLTVQIGDLTRPAPDSFTVFAPVPSITSFSPLSADTGAVVTITGVNFRTTTAENTVYFGGVRASVLTASATQLTVRVPKGAQYAPISVTTLGSTARSNLSFTPTYRGPSGVTSFSDAFNVSTSSTDNVQLSTGNATPRGIVTGDLDNDGKLDLVVANNTASGGISVFRNTSTSGSIGSGTFASVITLSSGSFNPTSIDIGDVDNDGKLDIIAGCDSATTTTNSAVLVFRNTTSTAGSISYASPFIITVRPIVSIRPIRSVKLGDIDNDGRLDIVFGGQSTAQSVGVIKNNSSSGVLSFETPIAFAVTNITESIAIGDIDGDGKNDIVSTNSQNIEVLRNIGVANTINASTYANSLVIGNSAANFSAVSLADLNNDGLLDLFYTAAGSSANSIVSYRANQSVIGSISFGAATSVFTTSSSRYAYALGAGDLDGDGKADLIATNQASSTVSQLNLFRNTTNSSTILTTFGATLNTSTASATPQGVALGDFDNDGRSDIAMVNNTGSGTFNVFVLRNLVQTSITGFRSLSGSEITSAPIGRSINITGRFFSSFPDSNLVRFGNDTAQVLEASSTQLTVRIPGRTLQVGNIVGVSVKISGVTYNSTSNFTISAPQVLITSFTPSSGGRGQSVQISGQDFSPVPSENSVRFGSVDAVVTSSTDSQINTTVPSGLTPSTNVTISVAVRGGTRVNASTQFSVLQPVPIIASFTPVTANPGQSITIRGSNFSTTASQNRISFGGVSAAATSVQGDTTLIVTVPTGATYAPLTLNVNNNLMAQSSQKFIPKFATVGSIRASAFANRTDISSVNTSINLESVDIDGDGANDIVNSPAQTFINAVRNTSSSNTISFATRNQISGGSFTRGLGYGDLNGDGKVDFATGDFGASRVNVYVNQSTTGSFSFGTSFILTLPTNGFSQSVKIADVDGDGRFDIIAGTNLGLSIFRNLGGSLSASSFTRTDISSTNDGNYPYIEVGDFSNDGKPDVIRLLPQTNAFSIFTNTSISGAPSFSSPATVTVNPGLQGWDVDAADFDRDGKLDLAVTKSTGNAILIYRNTHTSGNLTASSLTYTTAPFFSGAGVSSVAIGDIDGDGWVDIAGVNSTSSISIFKNLWATATSEPFFSNAVTVPISISSADFPISLTDFNGDGKPELIYPNGNSGIISILRNDVQPPVPPTITSFTPTSAAEGDAVTITGANFDTNPEGNTVRFGSIAASLNTNSVTSTSLQAFVPAGLTVGSKVRISVQTIDGSVSSIDSMTVLQADFRPIVSINTPTSISTTSAVVSGTVNPRGRSTTYRFQYDTSSTFETAFSTSQINAGSGSSNVSTGNVSLTGLLSGQTYFVRLSATNSEGTRVSSTQTFTTQALPIVQTLAATNVSGTSATLRGSVNARGISTNVTFSWGTNQFSLSNTTSTQVVSSNSDQTVTATINISNPDLTYYYRINASNVNGSVNGSTLSFVPLATFPRPTSPTDFASNQGPEVTFQWSGFSNDAQSYQLELATQEFSGESDNPTTFRRFSGITVNSFKVFGLPSNTTIFWRVRGLQTGGSNTYSLWSSSSTSFPNTRFSTNFSYSSLLSISSSTDTRTEELTFTSSGSPNPEDYRLFSIPGGDKSVSIIGGKQGVTWRTFADNGADNNFLVELNGENDIFVTGQGYWLLSTRLITIPYNTLGQISGFQRVLPRNSASSSEFRIVLNRNTWTIISNPYLSDINWSGVVSANSLPANAVIWEFNNGTWSQATTMKPFRAYYYRASTSPTSEEPTLRLPTSLISSGTLATLGEGNLESQTQNSNSLYDWRVKISMKSSSYTDGDNYIGISKAASDKFDELDTYKPPILANQTAIVFNRKNWDENYTLFSGDIRESIGNGQVWEMTAYHTKLTRSSLEFENIHQIPEQYDVKLINVKNGNEVIDLRNKSSYSYMAANREMPFKVIVGEKAFVESELKRILPTNYSLSQNFPNPFNPSTSIAYALPSQSRVSLEVYDLLGRKVAILVNGIQNAGSYTVGFNASNLASGMYIYRISANPIGVESSPFSETKKMVLIK
ncbi:MAG: FG-GAP-like repeat-containing protein [Chloroherpetonaceae bacterium]|nr:FG-GAP-like repeat-containing protein [Chloroherpetonaceae bacterium]